MKLGTHLHLLTLAYISWFPDFVISASNLISQALFSRTTRVMILGMHLHIGVTQVIFDILIKMTLIKQYFIYVDKLSVIFGCVSDGRPSPIEGIIRRFLLWYE